MLYILQITNDLKCYNYPNSRVANKKYTKIDLDKEKYVSHFATTIFQRLRQVVQKTLEDNGIDPNHSFYEPCTERLYSLCKSFLKVSLLRSLVIASTSFSKWATSYV